MGRHKHLVYWFRQGNRSLRLCILTDFSKPLVTKITMMMAMIKTMASSLYISGQFFVICFLQSVCALFCYVPQDLGPLAVLEICPLELGITQFPFVFWKVVGFHGSLICSKERLLGGGVRVTHICEYKAMYLTGYTYMSMRFYICKDTISFVHVLYHLM